MLTWDGTASLRLHLLGCSADLLKTMRFCNILNIMLKNYQARKKQF